MSQSTDNPKIITLHCRNCEKLWDWNMQDESFSVFCPDCRATAIVTTRMKGGVIPFTAWKPEIVHLPERTSTHCLRCRRPLRNPDSIRIGFGPVCAAKEKADPSGDLYDPFGHDLEGQYYDLDDVPGLIRCERRADGRHFSFPQTVVRHSPTGMEWGYGGSGPADFAINALIALGIPHQEAENPSVYQAFKRDFVANLPHEGGTITKAEAQAWYLQVTA